MTDFVVEQLKTLLARHQLDSFDALWALELPTVDQPNRERGGWSSVCRLELSDEGGSTHGFYIKRQLNHMTRSVQRPFGEPTFARELRNILHYQAKSVPALEAAYYAERKMNDGQAAVLITRALDDYRPLDQWLETWEQTATETRQQVLDLVGKTVGQLHAAHLTHHCLYPKHIFIALENATPARFIDLEKTRYQWIPKREAVADLEALLRRAGVWNDEERGRVLSAYLRQHHLGLSLQGLRSRLQGRRQNKDARP